MTISRIYSKVIMRKLCSNHWKIVWIPGIPLLGEAKFSEQLVTRQLLSPTIALAHVEQAHAHRPSQRLV